MANVFGILKGLVSAAATVFSLLHGKKPSLPELLPGLVTGALQAVDQAMSFGTLTTKDQIDAWLDTFDMTTGADPGALNLAPSMPLDKEEEMLDHLKEAIRAYAYNRAKVAGYVIAAA